MIEKIKAYIKNISKKNNEPKTLLDERLRALEEFLKRKNEINFNFENFFESLFIPKKITWDEIPEEIKNTYKELGISNSEQAYLSGISLEYNENIFNKVKEIFKKKGLIFTSYVEGYKKYENIFNKYRNKLIKPNALSYLNNALFNVGNFIYVPKNKKINIPLQVFFLLTNPFSHFPRNLIILDEGAELTYIEGCIAPTFMKENLHSAYTEIYVHKNAKFKWINVQNWHKNMYVLDNAALDVENGNVKIITINVGSKIVKKIPNIYLNNSNLHINEIGLSDKNELRTGARIYVKNSSNIHIESKSLIKHGKSIFELKLDVNKNSKGKAFIECDSYMLSSDGYSLSDPQLKNNSNEFFISHESLTGDFDTEKLEYLKSRGIDETHAKFLLTIGEFDDILKELPLDYINETMKLIQLYLGDNGGTG